jgi:peptide deformylase
VCTPYTPEEILGDEAQRLVDDMIDTAFEYDGAGLAAPQVHVTRRLVIMEWSGRRRDRIRKA